MFEYSLVFRLRRNTVIVKSLSIGRCFFLARQLTAVKSLKAARMKFKSEKLELAKNISVHEAVEDAAIDMYGFIVTV